MPASTGVLRAVRKRSATNGDLMTQPIEELSDLDRELLNAVQWDFPLTDRPYAALSERLGVTHDDVLARVAHLKDAGVLRQLSAIFDTRALRYNSALVADKIDPYAVAQA